MSNKDDIISPVTVGAPGMTPAEIQEAMRQAMAGPADQVCCVIEPGRLGAEGSDGKPLERPGLMLDDRAYVTPIDQSKGAYLDGRYHPEPQFLHTAPATSAMTRLVRQAQVGLFLAHLKLARSHSKAAVVELWRAACNTVTLWKLWFKGRP